MSEINTKIRITAEHEIVGSTNKLHSYNKRPPATSSPSCFSHISYSEKTSLEIYVGLQAFLSLIFQFQTKIYVNVFLHGCWFCWKTLRPVIFWNVSFCRFLLFGLYCPRSISVAMWRTYLSQMWELVIWTFLPSVSPRGRSLL